MCPVCELPFDRGGVFRLGAWALVYAISGLAVALPLVVLGLVNVLALDAAIALAVALGGVGTPLLLYRSSWSWWVAIYYLWAPQRLPAKAVEDW